MSSYREFVINEIDNERYVEYQSVSISCINDFYEIRSGKIKYQVHCDDYKAKFSRLYDSLDTAVKKFMEIRRKLMSYKGASH
jgi:hypothetical protein